MSTPAVQSGDSRILAAFHAVGESWRVVIARLEAQRAVFVDAKTFAPGETGGIEDWLASHTVGRIVGVVPGSAIICRTCNLPNGSPAQLESALRLQAESQLLGSVPAHRLATAVLHEAEGESSRSGLIVGWPETSKAPKPPVPQSASYAPVIASLAALLNGSRPTEPVMLVNRSDGSIALSLTHSGGAIFRAARIDTSSDDAGMKSILRTLTETALSVGHTGEFIDETTNHVRSRLESAPFEDAMLLLPSSMPAALASRLHGAPSSAEWWSTYGIAAGTALAASDQLAPLTQMFREPAAKKPSRFRELAVTLSERSTAMKLLVACLAILIVAPVAMSGMRLLILNIRYSNLDEQLREIESSTQKLAMYRDLKEHAWPMTKVLSDLVGSAPEGIELETIAVDHGKELRIQGVARSHEGASPIDAIEKMQANMQLYNVFKDIRASFDNPNAMGSSYELNLNAHVNDPHVAPDYPEVLDFAEYTLAQRKYGRDAFTDDADAPPAELASRPVGEQQPSAVQPRDERPASRRPTPPDQTGNDRAEEEQGEAVARNDEPRRGGRPSLSGNTGTAEGVSTRDGGGGAPIERIPQELTDAQIAAMSEAEVRDAQASVARALQRAPGLDAETRDRLRREFRSLGDRLRELDQ